jgi:hypothetical protein
MFSGIICHIKLIGAGGIFGFETNYGQIRHFVYPVVADFFSVQVVAGQIIIFVVPNQTVRKDGIPL